MRLYASLFAMLVLILSCSPHKANAAEIAGQIYFSMEEAAHDALVDAYNCSEGVRECGGAIYRRAADRALPYVTYFYSTVETSNRPFNVRIVADGELPPPMLKLVGDYHNHLCKGNKKLVPLFSFADLITNQGFHTVGYMLDGCSGNIHRYDPAQDAADDVVIHYTSGRELDLTAGHIVGWINVFRRVK